MPPHLNVSCCPVQISYWTVSSIIINSHFAVEYTMMCEHILDFWWLLGILFFIVLHLAPQSFAASGNDLSTVLLFIVLLVPVEYLWVTTFFKSVRSWAHMLVNWMTEAANRTSCLYSCLISLTKFVCAALEDWSFARWTGWDRKILRVGT